MSTRWAFVVALSLACVAGVVEERSAGACGQSGQSRPSARVQRGRNGRGAPTVAPLPPTQPSAVAAGSFEAYNLDAINAYRRAGGLEPVALDPTLTSFARAGSAQLMNDHVPHQHFRSAGDAIWHQGFKGSSAENQGDNNGWPRAASDPTQNERRQIDQILGSMMAEGSGGGHFRNMMNSRVKRVGIGLIEDSAGKLYLTNDFSE